MSKLLSVVIPTYNPDLGRLSKVLSCLHAQTLPKVFWEIIIIDNCSSPPVSVPEQFLDLKPRIVYESKLGLTSARWRGAVESSCEHIVFVDDDNLVAPDYLFQALSLFHSYPNLGAIGGKSIPQYETMPPSWFREGMAPLGCRDLGENLLFLYATDYAKSPFYPEYAPIGAGLAVRKQALDQWLNQALSSKITDRCGQSLSSAGDCDIVLYILEAGWDIGYAPSLSLTHLLPAARVTERYLYSISRCAFRDFIRVLDVHGIRPWSSISPWTVPLRKAKSFVLMQPWRSPERNLRWHTAMGQYEGRASLEQL